MTDDKDLTLDSYNNFAEEFAQKFTSIGVRRKDIKKAFSFFNGENKNLKVFELGCGSGRDAAEITKYTKNYLGIDAASKLIKIAKKGLPRVNFAVSDFLAYKYPDDQDVVFAFASIIHLNKCDLSEVFKKVANSLKLGGIFQISMKSGKYQIHISADELGERVYYYYTKKDLIDIAGNRFKLVSARTRNYLHDVWLNLIFQKI
jgi:trans-aconitate methyltransferase